jgi:hypothetical protein
VQVSLIVFLMSMLSGEDRTADADSYPTGTDAYRPSAHWSGLSAEQKLTLVDNYRREVRIVYAKHLAVLVEGKKQQLQQGIKVPNTKK